MLTKLKLGNGLEVVIDEDPDGFPIIDINTFSNFMDENNRPTIEICLNGARIHKMFDENDLRWKAEF